MKLSLRFILFRLTLNKRTLLFYWQLALCSFTLSFCFLLFNLSYYSCLRNILFDCHEVRSLLLLHFIQQKEVVLQISFLLFAVHNFSLLWDDRVRQRLGNSWHTQANSWSLSFNLLGVVYNLFIVEVPLGVVHARSRHVDLL